MDHHAEGRIKKIKIRNFMTYDFVELYPKKGLNLVVGLNGSGKSSIMCAIALGLAGKPHFTGRATHLSDFIKHGCQEAEIEIELEKERGNLLISRKIKGDKCEWLLNHGVSNQSEVAQAVKCCNIDTSNLCQFLPQEKVAEFSRMDKKQRLENMLQTIGEPRLFQLFNELKNLDTVYSDMKQNMKKIQTKKSAAEEENERISDEVKKQEGRVRLKRELEDLLVKMKLDQYKTMREEVESLKSKRKDLKAEQVTLMDELKQSNSAEDAILKSYFQYSEQKEGFTTQRNRTKNKITTAADALRTLKAQAENANIEYKNRLIEVEDEKKRLHDLNEQIEGLKQYLTEGQKEFLKHQEKDVLNSENLLRLQQELNSLYGKIEEVSTERNRINYGIQNHQKQLSELQNEHSKKMENLKRRDRYTYEAASWLLANRHMFISNVYLPIMLEIKVLSTEHSKYVESCIPFRDMIAFVCENKSDYEKFTDIVAQKEWPVNVVMPPDAPISKFAMRPLQSNDKKYGLQCYVSDLFTAPEPILKYLFHCHGVHRIPVAPAPVSPNNVNTVLQKFRTFFSGSYKIVGRVSKYGARNMSQRKDFIVENNLLSIHNDELQSNVENQLQVLQEQQVVNAKKLEELESERRELEKKQELIRQEKKVFIELKKKLYKHEESYNQKLRTQNGISQINVEEEKQQKVFIELKKKLYKHEESYKQKLRTQNQISRINVEEEKQQVTNVVRNINAERLETLTHLNKLFKEFVHFEKETVKVIICMNSLSKSFKLAKSENEEIQEKLKSKNVEFQEVDKKFREEKNRAKIILEEIRAAGGNYIKYIEDRDLCTELNLEGIEERISHIRAQLSVDEDNEPLVANYNARKKKIEEYQAEINNLMCKFETLKEDIEERKTEWLTALQKHIGNINKKFSRYFKQLNCVGEINLDIPDNPDDFTNYGLQIRLKFRDEEPLVELSQTRHSGGECSVAAIVFILSLQELTDVPFRCIDEINQGMDSVNERKIYQLIADSVGDDKCSQYFLLTPKLLPDLQYPKDVAIHIIFNSCFLNIKLDVKKHLKLYHAL